jgi:hypothetical protein
LSAQLDAASQPHSYFRPWYAAGTLINGELNEWKMSKTTAQVLGYKASAIDDDDTLQALTSANPNHQWYWHIMTSMSDQTSTGDVRHYVVIDYDVEFFDRLDTLIDEKVMRVPRSMSARFMAEIQAYNYRISQKELKGPSSRPKPKAPPETKEAKSGKIAPARTELVVPTSSDVSNGWNQSEYHDTIYVLDDGRPDL